MGVLVIP